MKKIIYCALSLLLISTSCKKESNPGNTNDPNDTSRFDLQKPEGYLIYLKVALADGTQQTNQLLEFKQGKKLWFYQLKQGANPQIVDYELIDANTISINNINFIFQHGKLVSISTQAYIEYSLLKKPSTNLLPGKAFQGAYYQSNGNAYIPKYFYSYAPSENKVRAGSNPAAQSNTYNYSPVCGIAAYTKNNANYEEFMVLVNGKLETNMQYPDGTEKKIAYGTFDEFTPE